MKLKLNAAGKKLLAGKEEVENASLMSKQTADGTTVVTAEVRYNPADDDRRGAQLQIVPAGKDKNPATLDGIGLRFGKEKISDVAILEAYNDHGNRRVVAEIICGGEDAGREQTQRDIHSDV